MDNQRCYMAIRDQKNMAKSKFIQHQTKYKNDTACAYNDRIKQKMIEAEQVMNVTKVLEKSELHLVNKLH